MLFFLLTFYLLKSFKLPEYQIYSGNITQQTQHMHPRLCQCWAGIGDGGPTLTQRWVKVRFFVCWVAKILYIIYSIISCSSITTHMRITQYRWSTMTLTMLKSQPSCQRHFVTSGEINVLHKNHIIANLDGY